MSKWKLYSKNSDEFVMMYNFDIIVIFFNAKNIYIWDLICTLQLHIFMTKNSVFEIYVVVQEKQNHISERKNTTLRNMQFFMPG